MQKVLSSYCVSVGKLGMMEGVTTLLVRWKFIKMKIFKYERFARHRPNIY